MHNIYIYTQYISIKMGNLNFPKDGGDVINLLTHNILQVDKGIIVTK